MWIKISQLLPSSFFPNLVCYIASRVAGDLFQPISFNRGVLLVSVLDPAAAANVQLSQTQIIKKINQKLKKEAVKKIKIEIR